MTVSTTSSVVPLCCSNRSRNSATERGFAASSLMARWKVRRRSSSAVEGIKAFSRAKAQRRKGPQRKQRNLCVLLCVFAPLREKMLDMDGVLVIDKPPGITSHDVVARARHILHERRIGHTGTLDPFATGVLVILLGKATRLAQFLS